MARAMAVGVLDVEDVVKEERMEVGVELAGGGRLATGGRAALARSLHLGAGASLGWRAGEATRRRSRWWRQRGEWKPGVEVEEG